MAIRDSRFRWWVLNARQRRDAAAGKNLCYRGAAGARDLNLRDIKKAERQELARKMILPTGPLPGTIGGHARGGPQRGGRPGRMGGGSRRGDKDGPGRIHAVFATFTAAICKWGRLSRLIRRRADPPGTFLGETLQDRKSRPSFDGDEYRSIVERYVSLMLEMGPRHSYMAIAVRGLKSSTDVSVDDHFATSEWGAGGITHPYAFFGRPSLHG